MATFIKVENDGKELLINLDNINHIFVSKDTGRVTFDFNSENYWIDVDNSYDDIVEKINRVTNNNLRLVGYFNNPIRITSENKD